MQSSTHLLIYIYLTTDKTLHSSPLLIGYALAADYRLALTHLIIPPPVSTPKKDLLLRVHGDTILAANHARVARKTSLINSLDVDSSHQYRMATIFEPPRPHDY